jgi:hypothetical protein
MDDVPLRDVPLDCEVTEALRRERLVLNLKDCLQEEGVLKLQAVSIRTCPLVRNGRFL